MPTYIQGSDVFIHLRKGRFYIVSQGLIGGDWAISFGDLNGFSVPGDTVHITIPGSPQVQVDYVGDTDDQGDFIDGLIAELATYGFTAIIYETATTFGIKILSVTSATATTETGYLIIGCTKSDTMNVNNELLEVTQLDQKSTAFIPGFQGRTLSIEQAYIMNASTGQIDTKTIREWTKDQELLSWMFEMPDSEEAGTGYITSLSISGGVNTGALATFEIQVTGETTLT